MLIAKVTAGLAVAASAALAYGIVVERNAFTLRRIEVPVLPAGERPLRVLHISDLHLTPDRRSLARFVDSLAALRPDLVVNTGDNLGSASGLSPLLTSLERLLEFPGVFVFGSNDLYAPKPVNPLRYLTPRRRRHDRRPPDLPYTQLRQALIDGGWHDVEQQDVRLDLDGRHVDIRGTSDAHLEADRYLEVAGPKAPDAAVTLGVTHAPYLRVLDQMADDDLDLILAGHTHGGQVCVPGYGALTTNCDLDPARVKGLSRHRDSALHVSAGLGTSKYAPYRFSCRPEATLLTLVPRPL